MTTTHDIPLSRRDFDSALDALRRDAQGASTPGEGAYQSDSSVRCPRCMFTTNSADCVNCTYCDACTFCSACTHCKRSEHCHASSYCVDARHCVQCSYVVMSEHCTECVFCFGCVGLVKKEFHILNRPFPRKVYFQLLKELKDIYGLS